MKTSFQLLTKTRNMGITKQEHTNKTILDKLIESCLNFGPDQFLPYLQSEKVIADAINKKAFYSFYKRMLLSAKDNSVEPMSFKIEKVSWEEDENILYYNLYDCVHKYSRLSIRVKESANEIYLDIMPF